MNKNQNRLPLIMAAMGGVLLVLRLLLYTVAVDEKNLLVSGHFLLVVIWALGAVCLALAVFAALKTAERSRMAVTSPAAAVGDGALALAIGISLAWMRPVSLLEMATMAFGGMAVLCLGYGAYCRARGKQVFFGCFCVVCVYLALHLVGSYRAWSSNPQLQDYVFSMLACVAMTMFAYQNAALDVGIGSRRMWVASGLTAVCFGIAAVCGGNAKVMYFAGAVWALTTLLGRERVKK